MGTLLANFIVASHGYVNRNYDMFDRTGFCCIGIRKDGKELNVRYLADTMETARKRADEIRMSHSDVVSVCIVNKRTKERFTA